MLICECENKEKRMLLSFSFWVRDVPRTIWLDFIQQFQKNFVFSFLVSHNSSKFVKIYQTVPKMYVNFQVSSTLSQWVKPFYTLGLAGFPPRRPGFEPGSCQVGFVVDKVALRQVFSEYFGFPSQSLFPQILHHHNYPGQTQ
jgi:hypothetical protein